MSSLLYSGFRSLGVSIHVFTSADTQYSLYLWLPGFEVVIMSGLNVLL